MAFTQKKNTEARAAFTALDNDLTTEMRAALAALDAHLATADAALHAAIQSSAELSDLVDAASPPVNAPVASFTYEPAPLSYLRQLIYTGVPADCVLSIGNGARFRRVA